MPRDLDLETVVERFYTALYRFGLSLAKSEAEAADLTQQTFFILAQHFHQIRDAAKIKSWLFTTLRREFLRGIRSQASHPHVEFQPALHDSPMTAVDASRTIDAKAVLDALALIDPTYRTTIELFYLSECSYKEIAETLEIPIGTVMSRLSRGKIQLKAALTSVAAKKDNNIIPWRRDEETGT